MVPPIHSSLRAGKHPSMPWSTTQPPWTIRSGNKGADLELVFRLKDFECGLLQQLCLCLAAQMSIQDGIPEIDGGQLTQTDMVPPPQPGAYLVLFLYLCVLRFDTADICLQRGGNVSKSREWPQEKDESNRHSICQDLIRP